MVHQPTESLAWRTLIQLRRNGIGDVGRSALRTLAVNRNWSFFSAIAQTAADPSLVPRQGESIATEYSYISSALDRIQGDQEREDYSLTDLIDSALEIVFTTRQQGTEVADYLLEIAGQADVDDLSDLFTAMDTARDDVEQVVDEYRVNILSMHQAKGLTADAVFIPACEDEYLPGRQEAEPGLGDERRLLYVSMTRARRYLHISFCENRFRQQQHSGRNPDSPHRDLTRFLRDAPLRPE